MSQKIIRPEGAELIRYLNDGYFICNECGAIMDLEISHDGKRDYVVCPACGWKTDKMDYEYNDDDDENEKEWTSQMLGIYEDEIPPEGCRACGGPYPSCKLSCRLFDE